MCKIIRYFIASFIICGLHPIRPWQRFRLTMQIAYFDKSITRNYTHFLVVTAHLHRICLNFYWMSTNQFACQYLTFSFKAHHFFTGFISFPTYGQRKLLRMSILKLSVSVKYMWAAISSNVADMPIFLSVWWARRIAKSKCVRDLYWSHIHICRIKPEVCRCRLGSFCCVGFFT